MTLTMAEHCVLEQVQRLSSVQGFVSGHHLRLALLALGLDKKTIGQTLGELVAKNQLERLKVTDAEGLFYMAYRLVRPSKIQ